MVMAERSVHLTTLSPGQASFVTEHNLSVMIQP